MAGTTKKYALIFSIAYLVVAVLVGVAGELFKLKSSGAIGIAAIIVGAFGGRMVPAGLDCRSAGRFAHLLRCDPLVVRLVRKKFVQINQR